MKITIDTKAKTIEILESISVNELLELLKQYKDYQILPSTKIEYYPISYPSYPTYPELPYYQYFYTTNGTSGKEILCNSTIS